MVMEGKKEMPENEGNRGSRETKKQKERTDKERPREAWKEEDREAKSKSRYVHRTGRAKANAFEGRHGCCAFVWT